MNQMTQKGTHVILIDDELDTLNEIADILHDAGYICHLFESAMAVRQGIGDLSPDLIVSDINLDGASGLELCRELKQLYAMSEVPVIFLSGAEIPNIIRRAHAAGGSYYLRKPFDSNVLIDLVKKSLWTPHLVGTQS